MPNLYPIKTAIFIKFLLSIGFEFTGSVGSHHKYNRPNTLRPIIIKTKDKEINGTFVNKYLKQIDCTWEDFLKIVAENKLK